MGKLLETYDFHPEVNEDIVGVNHGFPIPLDIIRKLVVKPEFGYHVVVYHQK